MDRYDPDRLQGFVRTACWRGWVEGGLLVSDRDLSRWWWTHQVSDDQRSTGVAVDLSALRSLDRRAACLYLAEVLGTSCHNIASAMGGFRDVYGPHQTAVLALIEAAKAWMTVPLHKGLAEMVVTEHIGRAEAAGQDRRPQVPIVWEYPSEDDASVAETQAWLQAIHDGWMEDSRHAAKPSSRNLRDGGGRILAGQAAAYDGRLAARAEVVRRSGTAWPWQRCVDLFACDTEWTSLVGADHPHNPFASLRTLYTMGISFALSKSATYLLGASG